MSQVELAKRYAKAILQLGNQKDSAKEYSSQVKAIAQILTAQPDVMQFFSNTTVSQDLKKKCLETLFESGKYSEDVKAFLYLLVDRSRMSALSAIAKATESILDAEEGVTRGKIKSASAISDQARMDYEKRIGTALGKKIYLEATVDEKVMGGVRVEVGGWTFDDSLETHLDHLADQLMKSKN